MIKSMIRSIKESLVKFMRKSMMRSINEQNI